MKPILFLLLFFCCWISNAQCDPPVNTSANPGSTSVEITCTPMGDLFQFGMYVTPAGAPAPPDEQYPDAIFTDGTGYHDGLACNTSYEYYVRSVCSNGISAWAGPYGFYTGACFQFGMADNWSACPVSGEACFDLHQNDVNILNGGSSDDIWFDVHYYGSLEDLQSQANEIDQACLASGTKTIYVHAIEYYTMQEYFNAFTVAVQENNCSGIQLNAFIDTNNNGTQEDGEPGFTHGQFHYEVNHDGNTHHVTSQSGVFPISDPDTANSYDIGIYIDPVFAAFYNAAVASYAGVHAPASGSTVYNFPITATVPYHEVSVSMSSGHSPRAGELYYFQLVRYTNHGDYTESGTITYTKPPELLLYDVSAPPGTDVVTQNPNGFTNTFTNLLPGQSRTIYVWFHVPPVPEVSIGQTVTAQASIAVAGDAVAADDHVQFTESISGSYDPNDKMEIHGPEIAIDAFTPDDYLTYTIRFENTGNADALNIKITDELDSRLDASTVRMVDASHTVLMDRVGSSITWRLNSIHLPPASAADPLQGHGYVTFEVKPNAFAAGDVIPNAASIYFDFNPAIATNTFETHFVETLQTHEFGSPIFALYPNPADDRFTVVCNDNIESVAVFDTTGKQIQSKPFLKTTTAAIDARGLQTGLYFVKITTENGLQSTRKLIKK